MVKPTLNVLEARHRLAPSEGQKEDKIEKGLKDMKTSRFKMAVLTLLSATIVFAVALTLNMWNYYAWLAEKANAHIFITATFEGNVFLIGLFILSVLWIVLASLKASNRTKKLAMLALLAPLVFSTFPTAFAAQSGPFITIRVLCAEDEEFRAISQARNARALN